MTELPDNSYSADVDRMLWVIEHLLIPFMVLGLIAIFVLLPLNLLGIVGHHGCLR